METLRSKDRLYWYSAWQFALSILAALLTAVGALSCFIFGILFAAGVNDQAGISQSDQALPMFLLAGSLAACFLLILPSIVYSLRRMLAKPASHFPTLPGYLRPTILILAFPLVVLLGYWVSNQGVLAWLILPVVHVLAIGLPIIWITYLAVRQLPLGSPQRAAGVFDSGLFLGPTLILFLEAIALIVAGAIAVMIIAGQQELLDQLAPLSRMLMEGRGTPEELMRSVAPWLAKPGVLIAVLIFAAVVVPLIEEALKPIGVWLLVAFNLSPAAGFAAGALCGAAYSLFESLALTSTGADWALTAIARIGAAIVHILNTGLMGWALVRAWRENKYVQLGLVYVVVVIIHGLWNALSVVTAFETTLRGQGLGSPSPFVAFTADAGPYLLVGLAVLGFGFILWFRHRLAKEGAE